MFRKQVKSAPLQIQSKWCSAAIFKQLIIVLLAASLVLLAGACSKQDDKEIVRQLVEVINNNEIGGCIKTDLERCVVVPASDGRYHITLKDSKFTTDLTWIIRSMQGLPFTDVTRFSNTDTALVEEIVLLYGPKEEYLRIEKTKGLSVDSTFENPEKVGSFSLNTIRARVEELLTENWDISELIKDRESTNERDAGVSARAEPFSNSVKGVSLEVFGSKENGDTLRVSLDLGNLSAATQSIEDPGVDYYLFNPDADPPDLDALLQKGISIADVRIELGDIRLVIEQNGEAVGQGLFGQLAYEYYVRPDSERELFEAGSRLQVQDVNVVVPSMPWITTLFGLETFEMTTRAERVNGRLVLSLLDMMQDLIALRDQADNTGQALVMQHVSSMLLEVMSSPPLVSVSIPELRHHLGELNAEAQLILSNPLFPQAEIELNVIDLDGCLRKIRASGLFAPAQTDRLAEMANQLMVKDEHGNAKLTIESVPDQPGTLLVNGTPMQRFR